MKLLVLGATVGIRLEFIKQAADYMFKVLADNSTVGKIVGVSN